MMHIGKRRMSLAVVRIRDNAGVKLGNTEAKLGNAEVNLGNTEVKLNAFLQKVVSL